MKGERCSSWDSGQGSDRRFIVDGVIAAMELGHLPYKHGHTYEHYLGKEGRKRSGKKKWRRKVTKVVDAFCEAFLPDYIMLGGGGAEKMKRMPARTRLGSNADAFAGGFRLWERGGRNGRTRIKLDWTVADDGSWSEEVGAGAEETR